MGPALHHSPPIPITLSCALTKSTTCPMCPFNGVAGAHDALTRLTANPTRSGGAVVMISQFSGVVRNVPPGMAPSSPLTGGPPRRRDETFVYRNRLSYASHFEKPTPD
jgi:hypothetical protein